MQEITDALWGLATPFSPESAGSLLRESSQGLSDAGCSVGSKGQGEVSLRKGLPQTRGGC